MNAEILLARQWVAKANNDLLNADNNLRSDQIPFDTVCFHCQQAVEKLLKAYLVSRNKAYPLTHDLLAILERISLLCPEAQNFRQDLSIIMPYAVEIRYPDIRAMPSEADAREARMIADKVMNWLKLQIPEIF
ncbi:MAG: HEPN domain-containing protein [Candidatus Sumerlaeota bacterium]|nr:HEPN domain-containing protein [Candidatus Sumerlaeota bacterium]